MFGHRGLFCDVGSLRSPHGVSRETDFFSYRTAFARSTLPLGILCVAEVVVVPRGFLRGQIFVCATFCNQSFFLCSG